VQEVVCDGAAGRAGQLGGLKHGQRAAGLAKVDHVAAREQRQLVKQLKHL